MQVHDHDHPHEHDGPADAAGMNRAYALGFALNLIFVIVEVIAGALSDSLALMADAGHNFSDLCAIAIAWGAVLLSGRPPSPRFTYGLRSSSIWAALINAVAMLAVCGGIAWEAVQRLQHPAPVPGATVIAVAAIGFIINAGTAVLFRRGRHHDLNQRGVFIHMAADAAVSLGVVIAGIAMLVSGQSWLDAAVSLVIVAVIVVTTWDLLSNAVNMALHAVPASIDPLAVGNHLRNLPGVNGIHDLHIWAMSTAETALTVHLVMPGEGSMDDFYEELANDLRRRFAIQHVTIQVERGDGRAPCRLASDEVV